MEYIIENLNIDHSEKYLFFRKEIDTLKILKFSSDLNINHCFHNDFFDWKVTIDCSYLKNIYLPDELAIKILLDEGFWSAIPVIFLNAKDGLNVVVDNSWVSILETNGDDFFKCKINVLNKTAGVINGIYD